jgi:hypothetical protein
MPAAGLPLLEYLLAEMSRIMSIDKLLLLQEQVVWQLWMQKNIWSP